MRTVTKAVLSIVTFTQLALTGCFSLSRNAPPVQHYVLGEDRATEIAVPPGMAPSGATVGVRTLRMAEYLATPFIVVRRGANRIEFSDFDRWGEDLARGIGHTTASYIAARAPSLRVESAPWALGIQPDYLIQLDVIHFEGVAPGDPATSEGEVWMVVTWGDLSRQGQRPVEEGDHRASGARLEGG